MTQKQTALVISIALCIMFAGLRQVAVAAPSSGLILVEAEAFADHGGWALDQQSMDQMGSPYLLAHGLGEPVKDAATSINVDKAGKYHLWVRTKDWVAQWQAPGAPGKFQVIING